MLPSYQDFMLPLLQMLADGKEHRYPPSSRLRRASSDMIEAMALQFRISDEERREMLASGNQAVF